MKLYIKEKVFSWGDKFTVWDAQGNERYFVEGEVFSFGKKLHIYNRHGEEVAFIKQELFTWMPKFTVFVGGRQVAQVCREFTFFMPKYRVDGLGWDVNGHFLEHDYEVSQNGRSIVTITKEWMSWGDSYELDISADADEIVALAVVLTIDCVVEQQDND